MDHLDNFESRSARSSERYDEKLHDNFRRFEATQGDEVLPRGAAAEVVGEAQGSANWNKWQGDVGEGLSVRVASDKLGLTPEPDFDARYHGIDGIYRDQRGALVLVESKFTDQAATRDPEALLKGNQMQPEWVEERAKRMQNPASKLYTEGNARLGAEIERIGADRVRRFVIATDPRTLEVRAYEAQADQSWKRIGAWSALEFDQPHWEAS